MENTMDLMKEQLLLYSDDFNAERQSREQILVENSKLKQQIKNTEVQFQKIREDFTTERSTRDLLVAENEKLKKEMHTHKGELIGEKQLKSQLLVDIDTLRIQVQEKDGQLCQLNNNLLAEKEEKQQCVEQITWLMQQIHVLEQKVVVLFLKYLYSFLYILYCSHFHRKVATFLLQIKEAILLCYPKGTMFLHHIKGAILLLCPKEVMFLHHIKEAILLHIQMLMSKGTGRYIQLLHIEIPQYGIRGNFGIFMV